ncbi:copper ion binding protein [Metallibacterium sp.]
MNDAADMHAAPARRSSPSATAARVQLPVSGMSCATCVGRVERALSALPGVTASVNLASNRAEVSFDPARVGVTAMVEAVRDAGYEVPHETLELAIVGMTCASCAGRVENALRGVPGVLRASVNLATERASVEGFAGALQIASLVAVVDRAGYGAESLTGDVERERALAQAEARRARRQLLLATPVQFGFGARFYLALGALCAHAPATWISWSRWAPRRRTSTTSICCWLRRARMATSKHPRWSSPWCWSASGWRRQTLDHGGVARADDVASAARARAARRRGNRAADRGGGAGRCGGGASG